MEPEFRFEKIGVWYVIYQNTFEVWHTRSKKVAERVTGASIAAGKLSITMWLLAMVIGCGPNLADFPFECDNVAGYGAANSALDNCDTLRKASLLSRELLEQAGLWSKKDRDLAVSNYHLLAHPTNWWVHNGIKVSGYLARGWNTIEVAQTMDAMLHEEIHAMVGPSQDDHAGWKELGYYGLDIFYTNTITGQVWACSQGPFTQTMINNLRGHGRDVDTFLAKHPECQP